MRRTLARLGLAVAVTALAVVGSTPAAHGIINGADATYDPGVVSLWTDNPNRSRCTGSLVDDEQGGPGTRWVMTNAHCIYAFTAPDAGNVEARLGTTNNTVGYTAIQVVPGQYWYNPGFDPNSLAYDVMLVKLAQESPANVPVMKWRKPSLPVGAITQAYGYGWTCEATCRTPVLQLMLAERVPDAECSEVVHASQLCFADWQNGYTMACTGDSGGPMKSPDFDGASILRWVIVGDGDSNPASCTQGLNGAPGRGMAINVGRLDIQAWMADVMNIGDAFTAASVAPAPPAPTARALALIN